MDKRACAFGIKSKIWKRKNEIDPKRELEHRYSIT